MATSDVIIYASEYSAHPQDRSDEARCSCDVEVLGVSLDPRTYEALALYAGE